MATGVQLRQRGVDAFRDSFREFQRILDVPFKALPEADAPLAVSDEDDDGIADADDNCVDDANSDQADSDGDGIGDVCDTATSGTGEGGDGDDEPDSGSGSNRTLAYAALLAVALVGSLVMFGREDER